ncbi:MAG: oxygen-dependent protoporphyrinogen oxidase [Phylliscum demangeonii]|nr:MAG: oxygen-dependent protoporphyrinogen oxidase [Phylliscum demangeonii]
MRACSRLRPPASRRLRTYATAIVTAPVHVGVIGGGITGLAAAFFLALDGKRRVTVLEGSERVGGWIQTRSVDVGTGRVLFEQGPRTLRGGGLSASATKALIALLGLQSQIVASPKANASRYLYYPDRLVRVPGPGASRSASVRSLLFEAPFNALVPALVAEPWRATRPAEREDESVGGFVARRLGRAVADNIVSGMMHGIYAGDVYQLSVKSLAPLLWHCEQAYGSLVRARYELGPLSRQRSRDDVELLACLIPYRRALRESASIGDSQYSFRGGVGMLVSALEERLRRMPNVQLVTGWQAARLRYDGARAQVTVSDAKNRSTVSFPTVLSTIPARALARLTPEQPLLTPLAGIHAVSVAVVNVYYADPALLPAHGFGYLIPRSVPWALNPECALGVVFDSDTVPGLDSAPAGTKLTVILGGHWWDGRPRLPDEAEAGYQARAVLARHLGIVHEPRAVRVSLQRDCIPQYVVGHHARLAQADVGLKRAFHGRLRVAGCSYHGISVNDCIRAGLVAAGGIAAARDADADAPETGLGSFSLPQVWTTVAWEEKKDAVDRIRKDR